MNIKPLINKVFTRKYQFALQPAAVDLIEEIFSEHEIDPDEVQNALELMAKECQKQEGTSSHRVSIPKTRLRYLKYL